MKIIRSAILFLCISFSAQSQPQLFIENSNISFDTVYQGKIVKLSIPLKNIGTEPLVIQRVEASCGCTTTKKPENPIQPKETVNLNVEFNSLGFMGSVTKYVDINSNDSQKPFRSVTVKGFVVNEVEPVDKVFNLFFGNITVGQKATKFFEAKNVSSKPISIIGANSKTADISVDAPKKIIQPGETFGFNVTAEAGKAGVVQSEFAIELDSKNQTELRMKLTYVGGN